MYKLKCYVFAITKNLKNKYNPLAISFNIKYHKKVYAKGMIKRLKVNKILMHTCISVATHTQASLRF